MKPRELERGVQLLVEAMGERGGELHLAGGVRLVNASNVAGEESGVTSSNRPASGSTTCRARPPTYALDAPTQPSPFADRRQCPASADCHRRPSSRVKAWSASVSFAANGSPGGLEVEGVHEREHVVVGQHPFAISLGFAVGRLGHNASIGWATASGSFAKSTWWSTGRSPA